MSTLRLDVELTTVDPTGDTVYVEGRASDGAQLAMYLAATLVRGSALVPGKRVQVTLELPTAAPAASGPSLRERMGRTASGVIGSAAASGTASSAAASSVTTGGGANGAAVSGTAGSGTAGTRATPVTTARTSTPATRGTEAASAGRTDTILSFMLGKPSADAERDIDDEMDALLGTKRG